MLHKFVNKAIIKASRQNFFFFLADGGAGVITFFCQADAVTTTTIMT